MDANRIQKHFSVGMTMQAELSALWVEKTFAVRVPAVGAEVTAPAQASHQDFQQWIERAVAGA